MGEVDDLRSVLREHQGIPSLRQGEKVQVAEGLKTVQQSVRVTTDTCDEKRRQLEVKNRSVRAQDSLCVIVQRLDLMIRLLEE